MLFMLSDFWFLFFVFYSSFAFLGNPEILKENFFCFCFLRWEKMGNNRDKQVLIVGIMSIMNDMYAIIWGCMGLYEIVRVSIKWQNKKRRKFGKSE